MNNIQHLQSVSTTNPLTNTYTSEEVSLEFCESDIKADKFIDISRKSNIQSFIDAITKRLNELFCKFNEVNNIDVNSRKGKTLLKTLFYFFFWYFFTVVYNISNKKLLNDFPLPFTVASLQLLIGLPVFMPLWIMKPINYNVKNIWSHSRIALMHGLGNFASVISYGSGSVSFAHVVKALEPVVAAILSAWITKKVFPISVYVSLIPIVLGVGIASAKELSFTWLGFISAMTSNVFYQLRIVLAKEEIENESSKLSAANLFRVISILAFIETLPITILVEGNLISTSWFSAIENGADQASMISNFLISGVSYYMYNEVAFWLLDIIHPITHAVGNTIKRVVIILASVIILKSPVNFIGMLGASLAVIGTLGYSIAQQKHKSNK